MKKSTKGIIIAAITSSSILFIVGIISLFSSILISKQNNNYLKSPDSTNLVSRNDVQDGNEINIAAVKKISLKDIPDYTGMPYVEINGNIPFFDDSELTTTSFEKYSDLDYLGRVGIAYACIDKGMANTPRENISKITPTGWKNSQYDNVDGKNLYNRCHLIANSLTGENNNEKNLITGTRYMNTQGMARFEYIVSEYLRTTDNHVLYRVTPMFHSTDLLAAGVLMEAKSVEDNGNGVQFCVFCYNVQPGIAIAYDTGENKLIEDDNQNNTTENEVEENTTVVATVPVPALTTGETSSSSQSSTSSISSSSNSGSSSSSGKSSSSQPKSTSSSTTSSDSTTSTYILNTNSHKFHYPWCSSVNRMAERNKKTYTGTRQGAINQGYEPCQICNP